MINEYEVALGAAISAHDSTHRAYRRVQIELQHSLPDSVQCRRYRAAETELNRALDALESATKELERAVYHTAQEA